MRRKGKCFYVRRLLLLLPPARSSSARARLRHFSLHARRLPQMVLADSTLHPVLHFGMSGMAHVRGQPSPVYRVPRSASPAEDWPPKYMKAAIVFEDPATGETSDWAFCDPRRLGRIKLVEADEGEVERHPPLSELGADPLLDMPSVDVLRTALARRNAPIKAVLLDQNGVRPRRFILPRRRAPSLTPHFLLPSAAVVWHRQLHDRRDLLPVGHREPLPSLHPSLAPSFPLSLHPSLPLSCTVRRSGSSAQAVYLSQNELTQPFFLTQHPSVPASYLALPAQSSLFDTLHAQIRTVTETAVAADADASRFPQTWLFQHRWSKGKKKKDDDLGFTLVRPALSFLLSSSSRRPCTEAVSSCNSPTAVPPPSRSSPSAGAHRPSSTRCRSSRPTWRRQRPRSAQPQLRRTRSAKAGSTRASMRVTARAARTCG